MNEHPFAGFIRALGKGPQGSRALTFDESRTAMRMILAGEVLPVQLGAFLTLMRVKIETPAETAGLAAAARASLQGRDEIDAPAVRLDWSAYAGKRRQLPWFLLAALLLAAHGLPMFMHGTEGYDPERTFVPQALRALGIAPSRSLAAAAERIRRRHFAFVELRDLQPQLHELLQLKPLIGLRSPVHTVIRMLNPLHAAASIQGVFHPHYHVLHQEAARLLGDARCAIVKGDGGESERNPDLPCRVKWMLDGVARDEEWPPMFDGARHPRDATMDVRRLAAVWRGDLRDSYAEAAVTGTAAIALVAIGEAQDVAEAQQLAQRLWDRRPIAWLGAPKEAFG